jgi:hypothetical protein
VWLSTFLFRIQLQTFRTTFKGYGGSYCHVKPRKSSKNSETFRRHQLALIDSTLGNVNLRHQLENIILNSKFISPELTHPPRTRALARVLWLCVNSREHRCTQGGGEGGGGAPHVPPIKIFENFHIKMQ